MVRLSSYIAGFLVLAAVTNIMLYKAETREMDKEEEREEKMTERVSLPPPLTTQSHGRDPAITRHKKKKHPRAWKKRLKRFRHLANAFRVTLQAKYNFTDKVDMMGSVIPLTEQMLTSAPNSTRARQTVIRRMMHKLQQRSTFTFVWTGTSVTAGHDNYYSQAYPFKLQQILGPILRSSTGLTVRSYDVALGGNPIYPYTLCLPTHVGEDADVMSWEMEMMVRGRRRNANWESFMRQAMAIKSKPSLVILGSFVGLYKTTVYKDPRDPTDKALLAQYAKTSAAPMSLRVSRWWGMTFKTKDGEDEPRRTYNHGLTNLWDFVGKCCGNAGWHPGPKGHEFFADIIAVAYLRLFEDALVRLASAKDSPTPPVNVPAPAILYPANNMFETDDSKYHPGIHCSTEYEPKRLKGRRLIDHVVDLENRVVDPRPNLTFSCKQGKWCVYPQMADVAALHRMRKNHAFYGDLKWAITGRRASGPLTLSFKSGKGGLVVCGTRPPWNKWGKAKGWSYFKNTTGTIHLDGELWKFNSTLGLKYCYDGMVEAGQHTLTFNVTSAEKVQLAHLIYVDP